jgi:hypothetical protein
VVGTLEKYIADVLNAKRADVTGAIKKVFVRKYLNQVTTKTCEP